MRVGRRVQSGRCQSVETTLGGERWRERDGESEGERDGERDGEREMERVREYE